MRQCALILMLGLLTAAPLSHADRDHGRDRGRDRGDHWQPYGSEDPYAERAGRRAQSQFGGRVLSIQPEHSDEGRRSYRVKLLDEGRVRVKRIGPDEDD